MNFTVIIEDWLRGEDGGKLLNTKGKRCCIGFAASHCGVSDDDLLGEAEIYYLGSHKGLSGVLQRKDRRREKQWVRDAYEINDDKSINDAERMRQLQELAIKHGHSFTFVHKEPA